MKPLVVLGILVASLVVVPLRGFASQELSPPVAAEAVAPTAAELRQLFLRLLLAPDDNPVQRCADHALRVNYGLMALRFARASPERIRETLLRGVVEGPALEQRQREFQIWQDTTAPGAVAHSRFGFCLAQSGLQSRLGDEEPRCFQLAGVPAIAQLARGNGAPQEGALAQLTRIYGQTLPAQYLADVVAAVYRAEGEEALFRLHRSLYAGCLRQVH